jgi:hypothetical protein
LRPVNTHSVALGRNDFFVSQYDQKSNQFQLFQVGFGGLEQIRRIILQEEFQSEICVAMFRVTVLLETTTRMKLVHVVYIGHQTSVMKRVKVNGLQLKQPFSMNLSIHTGILVDTDLDEAIITRALSPCFTGSPSYRLDFTNSSSARNLKLSFAKVWENYLEQFHARNVDELVKQYADDSCKLLLNYQGSVSVFQGKLGVQQGLHQFFQENRGDFHMTSIDKTQPNHDDDSHGIIFSCWSSDESTVLDSDTIVIVKGRIVVHTMVIQRSSSLDKHGDLESADTTISIDAMQSIEGDDMSDVMDDDDDHLSSTSDFVDVSD